METRARDLDREVYQDPDSDCYSVPSKTVFDNASDDLETIAVSKRSMSLLPLRQYFIQKEGGLDLNKDGIVACKRRDEDKVMYKCNVIVLPQLYQTEEFRSHNQTGHQGLTRYTKRF